MRFFRTALRPRGAAGLALSLLLCGAGYSGNIVDPIPGDAFGTYSAMKEFNVNIKSEDGVTDQALKYRIYRYGAVGKGMPLLVQVHEWGGDFLRMEGITQYEHTGLPFVMLAFQFANPADNQSNWWYGKINRATNQTVPYIHDAIIGIIRQLMTTDIVQTAVSCTIDTNRIYIFGHSIGGTGAVMLGLRHPEIFAAVSSHAGWTTFEDVNRAAGEANHFRTAFNSIIGTVAGVDPGINPYPDESLITIQVNADIPGLALGKSLKAGLYTDLAWYFTYVRDASWPSPFLYYVCGASDDPVHQGDHIQPMLESQKRGYTYNRADGPHTAGGVFVRMERLYKFRRDQSFLAFTARNYGLNKLDTTGFFNDLSVHGWDPATIVESENHYFVKLTGTGLADVTLRRLQKLKHDPGTVFQVRINGKAAPSVTADAYGLVTVPAVKDAATMELFGPGAAVRPPAHRSGKASSKRLRLYGPEPESAPLVNLEGRRMPASPAYPGLSNASMGSGLYFSLP